MTSFGVRKFNSTLLPPVDQQEVHKFRQWRSQNSALSLALEIGPGVGFHPLKFARENPDKCLIAVEHTKNKFEKFKRRYDHHNTPTNLLPVHANAISWAHHVLENESLSQCLILYPNPSPKKSDLAKRWHAMPFMERLLELICPRGQLILATNMAFYEQEAQTWFLEHWGLKLVERKELTLQNWPIDKHRTHFERKYLERGEICYNLIFEKR